MCVPPIHVHSLPIRAAHIARRKYENVLRDSGLHDAVHACEHAAPDVRPFFVPLTILIFQNLNRDQEPLSLVPACTPAALRGALSAFAHWLASLDAVHAPRLAALTAPFLHARVHRAVQRRLGRAYAALCARVRDPRSRYEAAATLLGAERPFGSVAALWQIFGINEEGGEDEYEEDDEEDEDSSDSAESS